MVLISLAESLAGRPPFRPRQVRDRYFENQQYRASGLNLVVARHHTVEHALLGTRRHFAWEIPGRRYGLAPTRLAARLGARRPDGRLSLALR
jgi:hypothetical protein